MIQEGQQLDKKSLRQITGRTADWDALAKDCVAFANAQGGRILIGIEDDAEGPSASQRIDAVLADTVRRKLSERTVNVVAVPEIRRAAKWVQQLHGMAQVNSHCVNRKIPGTQVALQILSTH